MGCQDHQGDWFDGKYELERTLNEERDKGKRALDAGQLALDQEREARRAAEEKAVQ